MPKHRGHPHVGAQTPPEQGRRGARIVNHTERLVFDAEDEAPTRQSVPWHNRGIEAFFGAEKTRGGRVVVEFRLQPIVDLCTGRTVGLELLAGLRQCPLWSAQQWSAWYAQLEDILEPHVPMNTLLFVNATGQQIMDPQIRAALIRLAQTRCVVLEWTEDPQPCDIPGIIDVIETVGSSFAALAVDDVGDGLDGIGRTIEMRPNFVKLSMKLLWHARERPAFLRHLSDLFAGMGAAVIAEGVETHEDLALARSAGVRYGQGFLFGAGNLTDAGKGAVAGTQETIVRFAPKGSLDALACGGELCHGIQTRCKPFPPRQKKAS